MSTISNPADAESENASMPVTATGGCLCGRIRWSATGPMEAITACHCTQCRKQSSHFMAFSATQVATLEIEGEAGITWFRASDTARRGFCATCGSHLFWHGDGSARISIAAASIDPPTGLSLVKHIFCADKGDYYEIADGVEQLAVV